MKKLSEINTEVKDFYGAIGIPESKYEAIHNEIVSCLFRWDTKHITKKVIEDPEYLRVLASFVVNYIALPPNVEPHLYLSAEATLVFPAFEGALSKLTGKPLLHLIASFEGYVEKAFKYAEANSKGTGPRAVDNIVYGIACTVHVRHGAQKSYDTIKQWAYLEDIFLEALKNEVKVSRIVLVPQGAMPEEPSGGKGNNGGIIIN